MNPDHGTNAMYIAGCRCADCYDAARAYRIEWRARTNNGKFGPNCGTPAGYEGGCRCKRCQRAVPAQHGTYTKYNNGCRCDQCRALNTARQRTWRENRRIYAANEQLITGLVAKSTLTKPLGFVPVGEWASEANCRNKGHLWMLAEGQTHSNLPMRFESLSWAIGQCNACPVLEQCRTWVMAHDIDPCTWHIVAAMTPKQRNEQRKKGNAA